MIKLKRDSFLYNVVKKDLNNNIGELDELLPNLIKNHDIFNSERLSKNSKLKDLGTSSDIFNNIDENDNQLQYMWWNSETQGNWRDGFVRLSHYLGDEKFLNKTNEYINYILETADNGYIGIYDKDLRFSHTQENAEFWAQSVVLRSLIGHYEATKDEKVLNAIKNSINILMEAHPVGDLTKDPYKIKGGHSGHSHGLTIVDVLYKLHKYLKDDKYLDYAKYLYERFSQNEVFSDDLALKKILNTDIRFEGHGPHTYEHVRSLVLASLSKEGKYKKGLDALLQKLPFYITPAGGPIGDEFIFGRGADSTYTGYEYCSVQELVHTYQLLMEKLDDLTYADKLEWTYYNAALGMKHEQNNYIMYLKTDNCYCANSRAKLNCDFENHRYKYSPTHQQSAVCCVPNSGRITPYFIDSTYILKDDKLKLALYHSCEIKEKIKDSIVTIKQTTNYPLQLTNKIEIQSEHQIEFDLVLRIPNYATSVVINNKEYNCNDLGSELTIKINTKELTEINLKFNCDIKIKSNLQGEKYFTYGPLMYCLPFEYNEYVDRELGYKNYKEFGYTLKNEDDICIKVEESDLKNFKFDSIDNPKEFRDLKIVGNFINKNGEKDKYKLIPMAYTILRKTTFEKI